MKRLTILLALLTACGDIHFSLKPDSPLDRMRKISVESPACVSIDNKSMGWGAVSVIAGVLGGGSGVASVLTDNVPRYVISSVGVGMATISAVASFLATQYATRYTRQCLGPK